MAGVESSGRGGEKPSSAEQKLINRSEKSAAGERKVGLSDIIELFQDPETEQKSEGYAFVWAILGEEDGYYILQVSFCSDPAAPGRKYTRKYRKYPPNKEGTGA